MTDYGSSTQGYAGFWLRVLARVIDNFIIALFVLVLYLIFFGLDSGINGPQLTGSIFLVVFLILSIFAIGYLVAVVYSGIIISMSLSMRHVNSLGFETVPHFIAKVILFLLLTLIVYVLYHLLFNISKGSTPGKLATGLEIRDEENPSEHMSFGKALGRFLSLEFISGIALGLGFLWPAWDKKKQAWHDKLPRTIVINKKYWVDEVVPIPVPIPEPIPSPESSFGELVFVAGRMKGKHMSLSGKKVIIGRGSEADIKIDDPDKRVSRKQFEIFKADGRYFIRNLSERRTTYLNGRRLESDTHLRENDEIGFSDFKIKIKLFK